MKELVARSVAHASGRRVVVGYVFMIGARVAGPLRATREEAMRDAVEAGEARACPQYGMIFMEPLAWVAPVWP